MIEFLTSSESIKDDVRQFLEEWNSEKTDIELYTSGSTGKPKKIVHKKSTLLASAQATGEFFSFRSNETILLCLSMNTIGGKMQLIRSLVWDMKLLVGDVTRNPLKSLFQKVHFCSFSPIQLESIIDENPEKLTFIETILLGGSSISDSLVNKITSLNLNVYEGFGMTETVSHIALRKVESKNTNQKSSFKTLKGINIFQKDHKLVINASQLGISNLETNDEIEYISPTEFRWLGRSDFVINSGGYKFHPELLEQKIGSHFSLPFFIIGEANTEFQEIVTIFVESISNIELEKELNEIFDKNLFRYEKPRKIYFVEHFIYTSSNKINKKLTQQAYFESKK